MMSLYRAAASVVSFVATAAIAGPPQYKVQLVPPSTGSLYTAGEHIDSAGDITLVSGDDKGATSYFFKPNGADAVRITAADGGLVTAIGAINDRAQVVGTATSGAFLWSSSQGPLRIDALPGYGGVTPTSINNLGVVIGYLYPEGTDETEVNRRAFRWSAINGMRIFHKTTPFSPAAINDDGNIAGTAYYSDDGSSDGNEAIAVKPRHGFLRLGDFATLGRPSSVAVDLNASGAIACTSGYSGVSPYPEAFIWTRKEGKRPIFAGSMSIGIADSGDVLAYKTGGIDPDGFIWKLDDGQYYFLDESLAPGSPTLTYIYGNDISSDGRITGFTQLASGEVAIILTPVRE